MARRRVQQIASATLVALSAAALAVPSVASACAGNAGARECCCKSHHATSTTDCHSAPSTSDCVTKSCPCCEPAAPQSVPPETTLIQLSAGTILAHVPWFHGGTEFSTHVAGEAPADLAAIPHRILHCSWLI